MPEGTNKRYFVNGEAPWNGYKQASVNLRIVIDKFIVTWHWFALFIPLGIFSSWLFLRYADAKYKVNAKILIRDEDRGEHAPAEEILTQLELFKNKNNVDNEAEILKTRYLMETVVRDLQLNVTSYLSGHIKRSEVYDRVPFKLRFIELKDTIIEKGNYVITPADGKRFRIRNENFSRELNWGDTLHLKEGVLQVTRNVLYLPDELDYEIEVVSIDKATADFQQLLTIEIPNKQVSTIDLTLISTVPSKGERILNTLIDTYLKANIENKNRMADSNIAFIDRRLQLIEDELAVVERNIQQFKQRNNLTDITEQGKILVSDAGEFEKQLTQQQVLLNVITSMEASVKGNRNNNHIVPSSLIVHDLTLTAIVEKYNDLQLHRERRLLFNKPANPVIKSIDRQLDSLRIDMISSLASLKAGVIAVITALKHKSGILDRQLKQVPPQERVFLDLSRQQEITAGIYLYLLKKKEESTISKSSNMATARIIDPAKSETTPFIPKHPLGYFLGLIIGTWIPVSGLYLKELLSRRIQRKRDITAITPVPILVEISRAKEREMVVVKKDSFSLVAEQFRIMRTNLQYLLARQGEKVILLTSSMSGEGKSFVAVNLAAVLALSDKKVALLEMDLRKPRISEQLGIANTAGFSTYAIGKASLEDLIKPSGFNENCWIISAGPVPPNPVELLLMSQTTDLFIELRRRFDYIIVDCSPVGLVTDAQILGRLADVTFYLVRQGYTFKQQLMLCKELYMQRKMPKLNLIVNDVKTGGAEGYGYGNRYKYGYSSVRLPETPGL